MPEITFPKTEWRLIIETQPRSGPANMAIDHAIAQSCASGDSPPTLRFYQWHPPAVSLGRHQPIAEIDTDAAHDAGVDIVRRTTGGRAILHIDELTYSVAAPRSEPRVDGGVMDAYLRISNGLLAGLENLGVVADKADSKVRVGKDVSAACFEVPSAYEITVGGRKLIGSAQSRRRGYVLQHGSLPLAGDITRLIQLLRLTENERVLLMDQLQNRACTLASVLLDRNLPNTVEFGSVAVALANGIAQVLNLEFPSHLRKEAPSPREMASATQLGHEQYANPEWTNSR